MTSFEALYDRLCHSPSSWLDNKDPVLFGPELIEETIKIVNLIRNKMKEAQHCQKSYANLHIRPLEFEVGDHVLLKISTIRGMMRFGKFGKLSPRYVGLLEILRRVRAIAYQLVLSLILT